MTFPSDLTTTDSNEYSKAPDTLIVRKVYGSNDHLNFLVKKERWDELIADYEDTEMAITELICRSEAKKIGMDFEPDIEVIIEEHRI
ncbi:hypothetical protein GCM10011607_11870 [Shewanella inventionis]|uniref:Uncharacterized protein n=1 Tax=Shewanella inventionis TaxID=1738770 RepID=A0ABQ1IYP0_9GAMM|nr:hypothetical protein [Shewanella inventionis]GGB52993.1 hypothetical protein GCM10011607_11870 [Shewanella inventionis]